MLSQPGCAATQPGTSVGETEAGACGLQVVGRGMIARAFSAQRHELAHACIFASGVADSSCRDPLQFDRERRLLAQTLARIGPRQRIVYFSSTGASNPALQAAYLRHKRAMEALARTHPRHCVVRLGQVVGASPNPTTLTNWLYRRIAAGDAFDLWCGQRRNLLDLRDVVAATLTLLGRPGDGSATVAIENERDEAVEDIVRELEQIIGRPARVRPVHIELGSADGDGTDALRLLAPIEQPASYLRRTLRAYYAAGGGADGSG